MPDSLPRSSRPVFLISFTAVFFPVVLFYTIVLSAVINLPLLDDYDNILDFLIQLGNRPTLSAKTLYVLTAQHNEYKLIFENAIFALIYAVTHHANFGFICVLGDLSILFIGVLLWKMFLPSLEQDRRLALFVPVSWLLFQLAYADTINWAAPGIQNLYIVVFSLATFLFLTRSKELSFLPALCFLVLSIATSGNGFITALIGVGMLLSSRRFRHALAWIGVTAAMAMLYAYRYDPQSSQSPKQHSVLATASHLKIFYILPFLGSVGSPFLPQSYKLAGCVALGAVLLAVLVLNIIGNRLSIASPVNLVTAFVVITAFGVAGLRSDFGLAQSMSGRYKIYSSLMLILCWMLLASKYFQHVNVPLRRSALYLGAVLFSVAFGLGMNWRGYQILHHRNADLTQGMANYEQSPDIHSTLEPILAAPIELNDRVRPVLREAEHLDIYHPPALLPTNAR